MHSNTKRRSHDIQSAVLHECLRLLLLLFRKPSFGLIIFLCGRVFAARV